LCWKSYSSITGWSSNRWSLHNLIYRFKNSVIYNSRLIKLLRAIKLLLTIWNSSSTFKRLDEIGSRTKGVKVFGIVRSWFVLDSIHSFFAFIYSLLICSVSVWGCSNAVNIILRWKLLLSKWKFVIFGRSWFSLIDSINLTFI
jgi:hypothetical protein